MIYNVTIFPFKSQAPISMKAVLQAGWLLTVAFGNLIVVIIASVKIFSLQVSITHNYYIIKRMFFSQID